jgi:hypothetical protein
MARPALAGIEGGHGLAALSATTRGLKHVHGHGGQDTEAGGGLTILVVMATRCHAEATERTRWRWATHFAVQRGAAENFAEPIGHGGSPVEERGNGAGPRRWARCPELGDMSYAAPRGCHGTYSTGRGIEAW